MITLEQLELKVSVGTPLEKTILNGIDLNIRAGEFVILLGTNGAGKSTLLNLLAGDLFPSRGRILIDQKEVTAQSASKRSIDVARVFQDPLMGTCGELTVAENMALAQCRGTQRSLRAANTAAGRLEFQQALQTLNLGLEKRIDIPMQLLSGGQRQAVSLVMSTLSPMKILLLDEHTAALDPKTGEKILQLTDQIIREKKLTAVMVTHSLAQAIRFGTRTVLLHEGRILHDFTGIERNQLTVEHLMKIFHDCESVF